MKFYIMNIFNSSNFYQIENQILAIIQMKDVLQTFGICMIQSIPYQGKTQCIETLKQHLSTEEKSIRKIQVICLFFYVLQTERGSQII